SDSHVKKRHIATTLLPIGLGIALIVTVLVSAATGQMQIPIQEVLISIGNKLGVTSGDNITTANAEATLWVIRFPRVTMAILVGAALAVSGTLMQAIFAN